ncbi:hypothetical protein Q7C36_020959 [Tachysurus vachellii]|uniref:non-specific serine/threonine protein kinase n=1 Tax=Tachysurus vachellii TaxID=175792 RepID=A0AA88IRD4_TACVA|nr:hypothetical protein Q7C36_020959 [Tachysurus vachellii]
MCSAERALSSGSGSGSSTDYQSYNSVIDQNFPCPLLSKSMKKTDLILFIIKKSQECLHDTMDLFRVEAYFFWQIMKLFCCQNGKLLMCEVALILLKGYGMIRKNAIFSDAVFYKLWCIPLAKLLFSSEPDDEHREAVIKMGDDFASKGLTYIAHICYVVAKVELGSREQFRLIGCNRFPFGIKVLKEAIMRTETYEYVLSLTSGVAQPDFQIFKLCNTNRLHMITLYDITLEYCEAIARAVLSFPDSFKRTFLQRVIKLSCNLQNDLKQGSEPKWLLELRHLYRNKLADAKANANEEAEQNLPSTSRDVASEIQEKEFDLVNSLEFHANWIPGLHLHNDPKKLFTSKYRTGQMLGQGSFGAVFAGLCNEDGKQVAIKCVNKKRLDMLLHATEDTGMLPLEVSLLKKVSQPPCCSNIVNLLEWFDLPNEFIMVLEWPRPCMDLKHFIELQNGCLTESQARDVMLQVIRAVRYCCERGVLHRDIKSTNLLINTETLQVKLIDFGCGDLLKDTPYTNYSGTPTLRPPEWILLKEYNGIPATMWALGILLYNLLTGEFPFISDQDIESGYLKLIPGVSQDCFELMLWCLDLNPNLRPTFEDLLGHEWFTQAV